MNIPELLGTRERIKILDSILYRNSAIHVNSVASDVKLSKGLVSKFLALLEKERILKTKKKAYVVQDCPDTRSLKLLLNISGFNKQIFSKFSFVKSAGLYGSCAKGTNTEDSDIDLWVFVEKAADSELAKLSGELKRKYSKLSILFLTKSKIAEIKKENPLFYDALFFGSIIIYGDDVGESWI